MTPADDRTDAAHTPAERARAFFDAWPPGLTAYSGTDPNATMERDDLGAVLTDRDKARHQLQRTLIELEHWQNVIVPKVRADRDRMAAGVPLVCTDHRHHAKVRGIEADRDEWRARAVKADELLLKAQEQRDMAREQLRDAELAAEEARGTAGRLAETLREVLDRYRPLTDEKHNTFGWTALLAQPADYDRWRAVLETAAPRAADETTTQVNDTTADSPRRSLTVADDPAAVCPTPCDDDCDAPCHEGHAVPWKRQHQVEDCLTAQRDAARAETIRLARTMREALDELISWCDIQPNGWEQWNAAVDSILATAPDNPSPDSALTQVNPAADEDSDADTEAVTEQPPAPADAPFFQPGHTYLSANGWFRFTCDRVIDGIAIGKQEEHPGWNPPTRQVWHGVMEEDCWTDITGSSMAMVSEHGPELVKLPVLDGEFTGPLKPVTITVTLAGAPERDPRVESVPCPRCKALPGNTCRALRLDAWVPVAPHAERLEQLATQILANGCPTACAETHTYELGCLLDPKQLPDDTSAISLTTDPSRSGSWVWHCFGTDICDGLLSFDHSTAAAARRSYDRHVRDKHQQPLPRRRALRPGLISDLIDGARRGRAQAVAEAHEVAAAGLEPFPDEELAGHCYRYEVDGEPVVLRGGKPLSPEAKAALAEVVQAAKRRYAAEHPEGGEQ